MLLLRTAVCCLLLFLSSACTGFAAYRVRTVQVNGTTYLMLRDLAGYYNLKYSSAGPQIRLTSDRCDLRFTVDRRETRINGVLIHLAHPALAWSGTGAVSDADFRLLLDPIMRPGGMARQPVKTIVIDPGHGGRDQGTSTRHYTEKELTLQMARRLGMALRALGYTVYYTRANDRDLTLGQRSTILDRLNGDVFVSLHINSAGDRAVNGIETFILPPRGTASTYDKRPSTDRRRGNQFDRYNVRLAYDIHRNLIQATGADDRGIKHANFAVLREATCPALLLELGFLSNATEERRLGNNDYQGRLVRGIMTGIKMYEKNVQK